MPAGSKSSETSRAYERGRCDGRHENHNNIYHPEDDGRRDYERGYDRGREEKSNTEAND